MLIIALIIGASASVAFGLAIGDYRSHATGPANWTTPGSWDIYTTGGWEQSTTTYPGGTGSTAGAAVNIRENHTITDTNDITTTVTMGTLTISGTLSIPGGTNANTILFDLKTPHVEVTQNLGTI